MVHTHPGQQVVGQQHAHRPGLENSKQINQGEKGSGLEGGVAGLAEDEDARQ